MILASSVALAAACAAAGPAPRFRPLPLADVRLTGGPLRRAQELDAAYLLSLEPDRMLAYFRKRAGLEPKAQGYGGWDGDGRNLTGHICGHYLSAVSLMHAATGDARFKERADYIVDQLEEVQARNGNGYLGALEGGQEMFARLAKGDIRSGGFDLNGQWAPFYTLHKMFAGLRDAHRFAGNPKALKLETAFAGWCEGILKDLDEEQVQRILQTEFGGMNEVLADLYADTRDERWLRLSLRFEHRRILDPLKAGRDELAGTHGNTQIPKLLGSLARYLAAGTQEDLAAAAFFWDRVAGHHSYATGGHGKDEYFGEPDRWGDRVDGRTCESCNVYNMLKLTRRLFAVRPDAKYAAFHERALYNHVLASISPDTGQTCYMVPVGRGVQHEYADMQGSFTCCVGSGMESHALHGDGLYHAADGELRVAVFADSTAAWRARGVTVRQATGFPLEETAEFAFSMASDTAFAFSFPKPAWSAPGFAVTLNGRPEPVEARDGWVTLSRTWSNGDRVTVTLPKSLRLEPAPDRPSRAAILWGPLVLAGDLGAEDRLESWRPGAVPVLVTARRDDVAAWLKPAPGGAAGTFVTDGIGRPRDVTFRPFHQLHHRTYGVYWDFFTPGEWAEEETRHLAEQKRLDELAAATVGFVQPGEMQPERDHRMQGEETWPDRVAGRPCRRGKKWFSFDLPVDPAAPMSLTITYYRDEWRPRSFTVTVDGASLGEQRIPGRQGLEFFDVTHALPADAVRGKTNVTVRFEATGGNEIGAVFGIRTHRAPPQRE